ncbi:MAG: hypothetical protein Q8Q54_05980 [Methylococcales bacterium]|nr:hypothetical protein [Methylococcales bacterium]MDP3838453.1 hypothetical protein [Methylococcales bacterium]
MTTLNFKIIAIGLTSLFLVSVAEAKCYPGLDCQEDLPNANNTASQQVPEPNTESQLEISFKVHNTTKYKIKQLLVSENGKKWGAFDIGAGIAAGGSETLVWDASTDNEDCKQLIKAVFSDDVESEPAIFDFCEQNLELEF